MKTYRMNAVMAGALYLLGTVFGVLSTVVGGDVLSSIVGGKPLVGVDMLGLVAASSAQLNWGALLILMMGISLVAMTISLYPIFRKDSKELAMGMLLFRGALEGSYYLVGVLGLLTLIALGNEYVVSGAASAALQSMGNVLYQFQDFIGPVGSIVFLIGATFLYISFYRTKLIPRWLSIWGLIGVVPYFAYALLHFFHLDTGYGFYLQMVLALQELVMGAWLVIRGFNLDAVRKLDEAT
ncbi:DUF4386 domain-containing protein [Candidatus Bipolaricaulota bacterium]|nr:DUF4386 domain-containing protein [Candidatus Bipolaricaulota bacterium]